MRRRTVLKTAGALAAALGTLELFGLPRAPLRLPAAEPAASTLPDIQFDIADHLAPAQTIDGVQFRFGPAFTGYVTAELVRTPTVRDQAVLESALATIEASHPFSPSGVFTFVSYGLPYFRRLPGGLTGRVVSSAMPRLRTAPDRYVLEEAVPSPTDVSPLNPDITKLTFRVPVRIESNDLLFTLRSDDPATIKDVLLWLGGSGTLNGESVPSPPLDGLVRFTSSRTMFQRMGLPRQIAEASSLPYAAYIHPRSPMWMGFADQQTHGSGPASICTFAGNTSAHITTAARGDYFDNGSIQHLSHCILDLTQYYDLQTTGMPGADGGFTQRVQYMFRSTPPPAQAHPGDQFTDGGGPSFLENTFQGTDDAELSARGRGTSNNEHRVGHLSALQRWSRAPDGTPIHLRIDGPGFDAMDVPDRTAQPKLQFSAFVPSADFFQTMRAHQAAQDLAQKYDVISVNLGIERFITATRRQNFLIPPRRHRAFPLVEVESR